MPVSYLKTVQRGRTREFQHTIGCRLHTWSNQLNEAVKAVNQYIRIPSAANLRIVVNTILTWKNVHPKEFRIGCADIWPTLHCQILVEARRYPAEFIECLDNIDTPPTQNEALNWVNAVNTPTGLQQFADYACLDASTFSACISGDQTHAGPVRTREADWHAGKFSPFGTNSSMAITPKNRRFDPEKLAVNYNRIRDFGGQGAVCTTFGYLAAHVLTYNRNRTNVPRVELVCCPRGLASHVFVLVGRQGGLTAQYRIPNDWDAVVVDAWAASLGHSCVFANRDHYVFRGMTENLELVMQQPAS
ncbi:hypothetical protein BOV88_08560 [Solemya velum gill symbiont]|uniref:Uncharacterized protein n=1 Tax=Solemya velum gill symbiont TaxID=2340 RepID=A0A1T2DKW3_SOVGS|nr:hypothetical protein BOV88_08560 [Solemya velum gill symbiont]OOY37447.1 hypothetical protein BOV89_06985 [Solemya velum gill symbiont]OOY42344.1 hypothetical protein BOV92_13760 [Solemya velum gill symbiont]OOY47636.1 hypothetical protein BOV93_05620 [Solemya velum gill symbiont]OOZ10584.1 hypothetical protein BOW25_13040 [Solemya velum gill symbiont]